jgi:flagellar hook-basal body complex protein FliE
MDGIKLIQPQINTGLVSTDHAKSLSSNLSQDGESFDKTLKSAIEKVNDLQLKADKAAQDLATGRTDNIAEVMIATEKADIALRLMMQVRNKMIESYQEIMKIQV